MRVARSGEHLVRAALGRGTPLFLHSPARKGTVGDGRGRQPWPFSLSLDQWREGALGNFVARLRPGVPAGPRRGGVARSEGTSAGLRLGTLAAGRLWIGGALVWGNGARRAALRSA